MSPPPSNEPKTERDTLTPTSVDPTNDPLTLSVGQQPGAASSAPGRHFGEYELLCELGRGGMGVVYKALQKDLNRVVAIKMILTGTLSSSEDVQRFRTEAEAAARLQHNNIVRVHEVGEIDGHHYYSMEYINGPSLSKRLAAGPLAGKDAAQYVLTIARAVHHAHRNGILHRDLKPSNVLLDAEGQPHITDFGLAKKLGDSGQTRSGAVMGTPSYMPPEQAAGKIKELGPASDVYSLGAILYELLTGRPPFHSDTPLDTLLHVLERDPAPPRLLNPKVDRDLETICLKCLEKDPRQRYPSAEALGNDLQRYLGGESISARSFNVLDRLTRTLDRNQYLAEFHTWGSMLLIFAAIVFVEHVIVAILTWNGPPYPRGWIIAARVSQFVLMAGVFYRHRRHTLMPTSPAERQLWTIWIGYLIACVLVSAINAELKHQGQGRDEHTMYPLWALLTGLAFFIMGSNYWGWCYALGLGFFALALLLPFNSGLAWSALEFGSAWALTLGIIGLYLRWLGNTAGSADPSTQVTIDRPSSGQRVAPERAERISGEFQ